MVTLSYTHATQIAQDAFQACFTHELYHVEELLLQARTELKRLSGDLPIVGHEVRHGSASSDTAVTDSAPFVTQSIEEARAWGWLELSTGVYKLMQERPGTSLVHFKRAWRIWRPWGQGQQDDIVHEARQERIRASLWLGEAWARSMSDRAERIAQAVHRAALSELAALQDSSLLQETLAQQAALPAAQRGTPGYRGDGTPVPYLSTFLETQHHSF